LPAVGIFLDEYQLREEQALYGDWQDTVTENTFDWNLAG
jgi:hypothetical protein